jgi:alkylation response protein AidB-like acyl-CoA dehydrogenase
MTAGAEEQKKQILPAIAAGEQVAALALTEPSYTWEPRGVETTASYRSGSFVLDGLKLFTMDAAAATHLIVVARTETDSNPQKGLSLFWVDKETPGVSVLRVPGFLAGANFSVKLDSAKVPESALIGRKDEGWPSLREAITRAIPVFCAYKVGGCQSLLDKAVEYSRIRVQFGKPIGRFQRVQDLIIDMLHNLEAARWTTYETLWKIDSQRPYAESVHMTKAVASQAYWDTCTLAHRVFSGISYARESSISFHTRTSRYLYNFLGEPAYHRQQLANLLID